MLGYAKSCKIWIHLLHHQGFFIAQSSFTLRSLLGVLFQMLLDGARLEKPPISPPMSSSSGASELLSAKILAADARMWEGNGLGGGAAIIAASAFDPGVRPRDHSLSKVGSGVASVTGSVPMSSRLNASDAVRRGSGRELSAGVAGVGSMLMEGLGSDSRGGAESVRSMGLREDVPVFTEVDGLMALSMGRT